MLYGRLRRKNLFVEIYKSSSSNVVIDKGSFSKSKVMRNLEKETIKGKIMAEQNEKQAFQKIDSRIIIAFLWIALMFICF